MNLLEVKGGKVIKEMLDKEIVFQMNNPLASSQEIREFILQEKENMKI